MFCSNCGKELFAEARFCNHCGSASASEGAQTSAGASPHESSAAPKPTRRRRFWKLHTRNWEGICPSCGLSHTFATTACLNDGSPLIVAFNAWLVNPIAFPIHTAHLCCVNNCGIRTNAVACNRCSTSIAHENLRFRMPLWRYLVHNGIYLGSFVFLVTVIYVAIGPKIAWPIDWGALTKSFMPVNNGDGLTDYMAMFFGLLLVTVVPFTVFRYLGGDKILRLWWPFRYTFTFEQVERAAHKWRRLQAKGEVD